MVYGENGGFNLERVSAVYSKKKDEFDEITKKTKLMIIKGEQLYTELESLYGIIEMLKSTEKRKRDYDDVDRGQDNGVLGYI